MYYCQTSRGMCVCIPPSLNQDYNATVTLSRGVKWQLVLTSDPCCLEGCGDRGGHGSLSPCREGGCLGKAIQTVLEHAWVEGGERRHVRDNVVHIYPQVWERRPTSGPWLGRGGQTPWVWSAYTNTPEHKSKHTLTLWENSYIYIYICNNECVTSDSCAHAL